MTKHTLKRLPVTHKALIQRINRTLAKDDQMIRKARPDSRIEAAHGEYVKIDTRRNGIIDERVDIEAVGRELGALKAFEELAS